MADDTGLETLLADDTDLETLLADDTDLVTLLADDTGLFPGATYDVVYSTNNMFTVNSYSYFPSLVSVLILYKFIPHLFSNMSRIYLFTSNRLNYFIRDTLTSYQTHFFLTLKQELITQSSASLQIFFVLENADCNT